MRFFLEKGREVENRLLSHNMQKKNKPTNKQKKPANQAF